MWKKLDSVLNGDFRFTLRRREEILITCMIVLHFYQWAMFMAIGIGTLALVNLLCMMIYALCFIPQIKDDVAKIRWIFGAATIVHAIVASYLLGWDYQFGLYIITYILSVYYLSYILRDKKGNKNRMWVPVLLAGAIYIVSLSISLYIEPVITVGYTWVKPVFSMVNGIVNCVIFLYYMVVFSSAIKTSERALEEKNRTLQNLAKLDPLTDLYNRRGIEERINEAMLSAAKRESNFCLVIADIDDFKRINDQYGHECGDFVLIKIATIMRNLVRKEDAVCRWGGEEILILLNGYLTENAVMVAERIRAEIEETEISYNGHQVHFTMTFGVQPYIPGCTIDELTRGADIKLYQGKRQGKNRVIA